MSVPLRPLRSLPMALMPIEEVAVPPDVSFVVVVSERPEPLDVLYADYRTALERGGLHPEFIFALPAAMRALAAPLRELIARGERLRVVEAAGRTSESALLHLGAEEATAPIIITAPAYRQIEPAAVVDLVHQVQTGADLAIAERCPRSASFANRLQHDVMHGSLRRLCGDGVNDVGCGVRAMRRNLLQQLPVYGDFARFLPFLAINQGYAVREIMAPRHSNDGARRLYGPGTYARRMIDVVGLAFLMRFSDRPLRFFGLVGTLLGISGAVALAVLLAQRVNGQGIADRPLLLVSVLLVTLGVQAIALGLIGEIIVHYHAARHRRYRLRSREADRAARQ